MGNAYFKKMNKVEIEQPVINPVKVETPECLYCNTEIYSEELLWCVRCDSSMHRYCYYSKNPQNNTKCPTCT